jgi:RNA-directed DNA polymerase
MDKVKGRPLPTEGGAMPNSDPLMNPFGGEADWRRPMKPALEANLMEQILHPENLHRAWTRVKSNQGAPGIDGMRIEDFPDHARHHWEQICQNLRAGTYQPSPVRRVNIPKPGGKGERTLGVPTVIDRVVQQSILQVLTPIFDPEFSESSYGSRPKRSAHNAIKQVKASVKQGDRGVADIDLEKFFDNVHHDVLMSRVSRKVRDKTVLSLIGRYLRSGAMIEGVLQATERGTPSRVALYAASGSICSQSC